jgi:diketogulonate reductase-like aldo/keto reductase
MSFGDTITLNSGAVLPIIGLGTWQSKPKEVENAVRIRESMVAIAISLVRSLRV